MRATVFAAAVVIVGGCHVHASDGTDSAITRSDADPGSDAGSSDAPTDAPLGAFGTPQLITSAATTTKDEDDASLSYSRLEIVFGVGEGSAKHLYYASRASLADPFGTPEKVTFSADLNHSDETPRWSADDTTLYFASTRTPTNGGDDLYMVAHPTAGANTWGTPAKIGSLSGTTTDKWLTTCATGGYLIARQDGSGNTHAFGGTGFGTAQQTGPAAVAELGAATGAETGFLLSPDCLTVWFASTRDGTADLFVATRATAAAAWDPPTKMTGFSTDTFGEQDPWMATDLRTFVFASNALGTYDIYMATR